MDEREREGLGSGAGEPRASAPPPVPRAARPSAPTRRRRRRPAVEPGAMVATTFRVWGRNLPTWLGLTLIVFAPYIGFVVWYTRTFTTEEELLGMQLVDFLVSTFFGKLLTGAVVYGVFRQLRGQAPTLGEMLTLGARRVLAVLGVAILQGIATVLPMLPAFALFLLDLPVLGGLLALAGLIGMLVVVCGLFVAIPVAVVERPGVLTALGRSWELTRGERLPVFGAWLLFMIATVLVGGAVTAVSLLVLDWNGVWPGVAIGLLGTSLSAILVAVVYHDVRANKEGLGEEELATIFD